MSRAPASAVSSREPASTKKGLRYNAVMNQATAQAGKPSVDYGLDNFSYDPEKVSSWRLPDSIVETNLPKDLYEASKDWVLAGAAVDTALERIRDLTDEAADRAFPSHTREHLMASRPALGQCSSVGGASDLSLVQGNTSTVASTPASSFSQSDTWSQPHPPKLNTALATHSTRKHTPHPNQLPDSITSKPGMESPPFTPTTRSGSESGSGARSPAILPHGHIQSVTTPNASELSAHLSPLLSPSSGSFTSFSTPITSSKPDMLAWRNYINGFTAELDDLRQVALPRLRGFEYNITKMLFELRAHPPDDLSRATAKAVFAFATWWRQAKNLRTVREDAAALLELPKIEDAVGGA